MNLILLGVSGSGKGTCAKFLQRDFGILPISTGDLLREAIAKGDKLGLEAQKFMNSGKLVPNKLVLDILKKRLKQPDAKNGVLLDGYPRNLEQAKALEKVIKIDKVIFLEIGLEEVRKRLFGRKTCKKCGYLWNTFSDVGIEDTCPTCGGELFVRPDDTESAVQNRIEFFTNNIDSLLEFYKDKLTITQARGKREDTYAPVKKAVSEMFGEVK